MKFKWFFFILIYFEPSFCSAIFSKENNQQIKIVDKKTLESSVKHSLSVVLILK